MPPPPVTADSRTLILYGTAACHLCEEAIALLVAEPRLHGWALEWVDIADDDALLAAYGTRIPVLEWPGAGAEGVHLDWPFDAAAVLESLGLC